MEETPTKGRRCDEDKSLSFYDTFLETRPLTMTVSYRFLPSYVSNLNVEHPMVM
jgi:hypothetical protein